MNRCSLTMTVLCILCLCICTGIYSRKAKTVVRFGCARRARPNLERRVRDDVQLGASALSVNGDTCAHGFLPGHRGVCAAVRRRARGAHLRKATHRAGLGSHRRLVRLSHDGRGGGLGFKARVASARDYRYAFRVLRVLGAFGVLGVKA